MHLSSKPNRIGILPIADPRPAAPPPAVAHACVASGVVSMRAQPAPETRRPLALPVLREVVNAGLSRLFNFPSCHTEGLCEFVGPSDQLRTALVAVFPLLLLGSAFLLRLVVAMGLCPLRCRRGCRTSITSLVRCAAGLCTAGLVMPWFETKDVAPTLSRAQQQRLELGMAQWLRTAPPSITSHAPTRLSPQTQHPHPPSRRGHNASKAASALQAAPQCRWVVVAGDSNMRGIVYEAARLLQSLEGMPPLLLSHPPAALERPDRSSVMHSPSSRNRRRSFGTTVAPATISSSAAAARPTAGCGADLPWFDREYLFAGRATGSSHGGSSGGSASGARGGCLLLSFRFLSSAGQMVRVVVVADPKAAEGQDQHSSSKARSNKPATRHDSAARPPPPRACALEAFVNHSARWGLCEQVVHVASARCP